MRNEFIETQNVQMANRALMVLEDIERGNPGLGLFYGHAGTGKTVCTREYAVRTGAVYLRVMEDWTPKAMLGALCREINGMRSEPGTVERCKRAVCEDLEESGKTVLVDEADRLSLGLIEHLRDVHDMVGVPVVFVGEEKLYAVLKARGRIWDRITQRVRFGAITPEDIMLFGMKTAGLKVEGPAALKLEQRSGGTFRLVWQDMYDLEQMTKANNTKIVGSEMVDALPQRKTEDRLPAPRARGRRGNGQA